MIFLRIKNNPDCQASSRKGPGRTILSALVLLSAVSILPACSTLKKMKNAAAGTEPLAGNVTRSPEQTALNEGISAYDKGDYNAAIRQLSGAPEIWAGDKAIRLKALKYMAFSYCVSGRQALCKQQFDKALKIDPSFDLEQGEKGHPLWGPVFDKAKKSK